MSWLSKLFTKKESVLDTLSDPLDGFSQHAREMMIIFIENGYQLQPNLVKQNGERCAILVNWETSWLTQITDEGVCMEFRPECTRTVLEGYYKS